MRQQPLERPPLLGVVVACVCVALSGVIMAWCGRFGRLRFFERGVSQTVRVGERRFLYEEIGELIWKKNQLLIVKPLPGLDRPAIRFRNLNAKFDVQLAEMRDRACGPLAERWIQRLAEAPVTWTARLRLLPDGLEYRPAGLLGVGEPVTVPYDCASYRIEGEQFQLFVCDEKWPACKERVDVPNFFVGLAVLNRLSRSQRERRLPDLGDHAPRRAATEGDERVTRAQGEGVWPEA